MESQIEIILFLFATAAGLVVGSFLNVVIHRGPTLWGLVDSPPRGGLAGPRSYCPACKSPIPPMGLIPVISFLLQKGRCSACGAAISPRYLLVELLGAAVVAAALWAYGVTLAGLASALCGFALVALAFIDLETGYLPDAVTLPLVALGLVQSAAGLTTALPDALLGAIAGYAAFRLIDLAYQRLRGREGLGQGDAKLLAAIGAWTGWTMLPAVILIAALATLAVIVATKGASARTADPVPFGPGLCAAGFIVLIAAPRLSGL